MVFFVIRQSGLQSIVVHFPAAQAVSSSPTRPSPVTVLLNAANETMPLSRLPVQVRLLDIAATGAVLSGRFGPSSCCRQPGCSPLLACCDCGAPSCALCLVPNASGAIVWDGLSIDLVGVYRLVFFVNEPVRLANVIFDTFFAAAAAAAAAAATAAAAAVRSSTALSPSSTSSLVVVGGGKEGGRGDGGERGREGGRRGGSEGYVRERDWKAGEDSGALACRWRAQVWPALNLTSSES